MVEKGFVRVIIEGFQGQFDTFKHGKGMILKLHRGGNFALLLELKREDAFITRKGLSSVTDVPEVFKNEFTWLYPPKGIN